MSARRLPAAALLLALAGCAGAATAPAPSPQAAGAVAVASEQGGRFIALVGPRQQHAEPFLGVAGTNFYALRSWLDTRTGEAAHQLYVEDSYAGAERHWDRARDGSGQPLKFVPISTNEITCERGCSYAEEFGAELPEALLRNSTRGLSVTFGARSGAEKTIAVPGDLVAKQVAALDQARAGPRTAAAASPPR